MRVLFLVLLLVNLACFVWWYWLGDAGDQTPGIRVGTGPELVLYSELDAEGRKELSARTGPEAAAAPAARTELPPAEDAPEVLALAMPETIASATAEAGSSNTGDATTDKVCATLGPFSTRDQAAAAAARLRAQGYLPRQRESGGQLRTGYWVYLPPFATRAAAEKAAADLKSRGISDLFIVGSDENRHAISLGLFSTPDRADTRAAQIGKLGFNPSIAERFRDAAVYWLDFEETPGDPLNFDALGGLAGRDESLRREMVDCPAR